MRNTSRPKSGAIKAQYIPIPSGVLVKCPLPSNIAEGIGIRPRVKVTAAGPTRQRRGDVGDHVSSKGKGLLTDDRVK